MRFDRIEVSNILDVNYIGVAEVRSHPLDGNQVPLLTLFTGSQALGDENETKSRQPTLGAPWPLHELGIQYQRRSCRRRWYCHHLSHHSRSVSEMREPGAHRMLRIFAPLDLPLTSRFFLEHSNFSRGSDADDPREYGRALRQLGALQGVPRGTWSRSVRCGRRLLAQEEAKDCSVCKELDCIYASKRFITDLAERTQSIRAPLAKGLEGMTVFKVDESWYRLVSLFYI